MTHQKLPSALFAAVVSLSCLPAHAAFERAKLEALSDSFWTWRATEQPFTNDDIPRIERASDFQVDWSPTAVKRYHAQVAAFEKQWRALDMTGASASDQIDYRLVGSAIARVIWELDVVPMWRENPDFYVQQSLGSVYAVILPPPPIQPARQKQILARLERIPETLNDARANLTDMRGPYVRVTLHTLEGIEGRIQRFKDAMQPQLAEENKTRFEKDIAAARDAFIAYRT